MRIRAARVTLVVTILVVTMLAAGTSVAAAGELNHSGTVGVHSVTDTSANPAATGKYHYFASDNLGWLTRFFVNPPHMRAVAGKSAQTVGWLFIVQRLDCGFGGCNGWHVTYTSPEMTAVTSDSHNASFSQATVGVRVPCGHNCEDLASAYRINIKMIWHRPNGSVQGKVLDRVYWYGATMTNGDSGVQEKVAGAAWSPDF